jgi:uncharacterized protein (DUF427 family)
VSRRVLEPGPSHPITLEPGARVRVELGGEVIADAADAILLREATYPAAAYIDPNVFDPERLIASDRRSWCPYKGEADYFGWKAATGDVVSDVIWRYAEPHAAVADIQGRLAFYTDRATVSVL